MLRISVLVFPTQYYNLRHGKAWLNILLLSSRNISSIFLSYFPTLEKIIILNKDTCPYIPERAASRINIGKE